jgi:hypothetical protein
MPHDVKQSKTLNAIQVRIDDNVRMLAELHARWDRKDEIARRNNMTKICTITTTSNAEVSNASKPPTFNDKIIGVGKLPTPSAKLPKITKTFPIKVLIFFEVSETMVLLPLIIMILILMVAISLK